MSDKTKTLKIDYSQLMDLRIDYAFKLAFGTGDTLYLISLLNAVFANKKIPRVIDSLTIINPYLNKHSKEDKLSILDIRAKLDDGSTILIEMHLYDLDDLKYKTVRSWARAYVEDMYCLRRVKTTAYKSFKKPAFAGFFLPVTSLIYHSFQHSIHFYQLSLITVVLHTCKRFLHLVQ